MLQYVCMGGTPKRMENFAHFMMSEIGYKLPTGTQLSDISAFSYRYSMYKVCLLLFFSSTFYGFIRYINSACYKRHKITAIIIIVIGIDCCHSMFNRQTFNSFQSNLGWTGVECKSRHGYTVPGDLIT